MKYIYDFLSFLQTLYRQRYIIVQLTRRDFKNKYLASYIGLPWAFIQPGTYIFVMWFVFTFGLKAGGPDETVPFVLWLICGIVPWFFISETVLGATQSLIEYSYLIKKVNFRPSIIPLIKLLTALIIHSFFILVIMILAVAYGFLPSLYWLQAPYYLFASMLLIVGIGWFTSSVTVFIRDMGQFIGVGMQVLFWATPIFWKYTMLSEKMRFIAYLNPVFYITNGYRETFISGTWFFEHPYLAAYYWCITFFFFIFGAMIFSRLKPHFADVL